MLARETSLSQLRLGVRKVGQYITIKTAGRVREGHQLSFVVKDDSDHRSLMKCSKFYTDSNWKKPLSKGAVLAVEEPCVEQSQTGYSLRAHQAICLHFEDCPEEQQLFDTFQSWTAHEIQVHNPVSRQGDAKFLI